MVSDLINHADIVKVLVTQSCPTLCDPMDYSLLGDCFNQVATRGIKTCKGHHPHYLLHAIQNLSRDSAVKSLSAVQETQVQSLNQEDPLEKGMATHSNILAWRIPWKEEPGGLQSMGSQRVGHD